LLSYGDGDHNIKIEINTRNQHENMPEYYEVKEYIGISMLIAKKEYLFASKLIALTSRSTTAMRDIYDIHFFAKNNWQLDREILQKKSGETPKKHLAKCIDLIEKTKNNQILQELGELLTPKEKLWTKNNLKTDTTFLLKNYMSVL
jgi:hypothetical protein